MAEMLPAWVPGRIALVYATGVIELVVAVAVLVPRLRTIVGWSIILMLLFFLPINIYASVNHVGMGGHQWGPVYLLIRIPLQAVLIVWVWWFAVRPEASGPIIFSCEATREITPEKIAEQILDVNRWSEFQGYGVLPGISAAVFEVKTPKIVGSRIRVTNTDGSSHVEEIVEWETGRRVRLHMHDFSAPLSRLATSFEETWIFEPSGNASRVVRTFQMYAKSALVRPVLWCISNLLRKAIARQLAQMQEAQPTGG